MEMQTPPNPPETVSENGNGHALRDHRPRLRVLLVDDDPGVRMLCSVTLRRAGLEVLEATDGLLGLQRSLLDAPDVVVLDVAMPGMDGFQLAELLRGHDRTRRVPLLFLTAEAGRPHRRRARALGALAYISKPFDPAALTALVLSAVPASPVPTQ